MISNPALKNVLTYSGSADLKSAAKEYVFSLLGIINPLVPEGFCPLEGEPKGS